MEFSHSIFFRRCNCQIGWNDILQGEKTLFFELFGGDANAIDTKIVTIGFGKAYKLFLEVFGESANYPGISIA